MRRDVTINNADEKRNFRTNFEESSEFQRAHMAGWLTPIYTNVIKLVIRKCFKAVLIANIQHCTIW